MTPSFSGRQAIMADDKDAVEKTIAEDLVVTKYKMAGEIVNSKSYLSGFLYLRKFLPSPSGTRGPYGAGYHAVSQRASFVPLASLV